MFVNSLNTQRKQRKEQDRVSHTLILRTHFSLFYLFPYLAILEDKLRAMCRVAIVIAAELKIKIKSCYLYPPKTLMNLILILRGVQAMEFLCIWRLWLTKHVIMINVLKNDCLHCSYRWAEAAERIHVRSLPRENKRKEPLGQANNPTPPPPSSIDDVSNK